MACGMLEPIVLIADLVHFNGSLTYYMERYRSQVFTLLRFKIAEYFLVAIHLRNQPIFREQTAFVQLYNGLDK
jgi:hypothetical protein